MFLHGQLQELETQALTKGLGTEGFMLYFMIYCHHCDVFTNFVPGVPHFQFALVDASDVASPVSSLAGRLRSLVD